MTNDIFTREDCEFLVNFYASVLLGMFNSFSGNKVRKNALNEERIMAVETGGCPHAAIREDITSNLLACEVTLKLDNTNYHKIIKCIFHCL